MSCLAFIMLNKVQQLKKYMFSHVCNWCVIFEVICNIYIEVYTERTMGKKPRYDQGWTLKLAYQEEN